MSRYIRLKFVSRDAQKSFTSEAEALAPLLRLGTVSWIVTRDSHPQHFSILNLGRGHQAEVRGPPVGRGPQVENC